jgi:hypothetical protein
MASPYSGPEPMSFEEPTPEVQETPAPQKVTIPAESKAIIDAFQKVVESPEDGNRLWGFTKLYLTYLEVQSETIVPFLDPSSKETLMKTLKNVRTQDADWGVYSIFLTISNIGSSLAQKQDRSEKEEFYIKYVMLSFDGDSPIYQFTQLLQTLQTQDKNTKDIYDELDKLFLKSFQQYEPVVKTVGKLDQVYTICGKQVTVKVMLMVFVTLLIILGLGGSAYVYLKKSTPTHIHIHKVPSSGSSVASDMSSVYSQ